MANLDLNLLAALDVLLAERSVTRAARRLGLSPSATSRTLARLRAATGDPLLVQAGRVLVPTPYAQALAARVHELARDVRAVLAPASVSLNLASLERCFTVRANEGFVALFAAALVAAVRDAAPRVRLRFAPKPDKGATPLREGAADVEIGAEGAVAPELRRQLLFRDRFVGVVRCNHPLFDRPMTPERYVEPGHVVASRRGSGTGPVDEALEALGLVREIVAVVPGFPDALAIARCSDLVALAPSSCLSASGWASNLRTFGLPIPTPKVFVYMMWHPRLDADPPHRWLREQVVKTCRETGRGIAGSHLELPV